MGFLQTPLRNEPSPAPPSNGVGWASQGGGFPLPRNSASSRAQAKPPSAPATRARHDNQDEVAQLAEASGSKLGAPSAKATVGRTNPVLAFERSTVKDEVSSLSKPDDIYGPPFLYDPGTYGLSFLLKWQGTILPLVFTSPLFWGLQTMHGLLLAMYWHFGEDEPALDWKAAVIPSSLLTFLLVSYSNQCFARYFQLYQHCTGLHSAVMDWVVLLKLEFGHMDTAFQWNCLRLLLGALQVHYALLGGDDVDEHGRLCKGVSTDEWRAIRTRNLLTRAEIERLQDYAGFIPCLPIGWALAEIKGGVLGVDAPGAIESSHELLGPKRVLLNQFGAIAGRFRDHSMSTFDILNAPVPFAYFHVMKLLLLLSLLIISYALIELLHGEVVMSFTIFFLTCLVMVGLSEIAIAMSDPFGDDQADFNLTAFLASVYDNAVGYLIDGGCSTRPNKASGMPDGMLNPLDPLNHSLRVWGDETSGLMDRNETPQVTPRREAAAAAVPADAISAHRMVLSPVAESWSAEGSTMGGSDGSSKRPDGAQQSPSHRASALAPRVTPSSNNASPSRQPQHQHAAGRGTGSLPVARSGRRTAPSPQSSNRGTPTSREVANGSKVSEGAVGYQRLQDDDGDGGD